jgi:SAM-dependent methyltransferase
MTGVTSAAALWSSGNWDAVARTMAPIHDRLVDALAPKPGERWLDVATGSGAVALRAARAGAEVIGIDIAPALIDVAEKRAAEERLSIRFDVGDAEDLPYEDASFEVVSSAHGVHFAPDHARAAAELARVCRPGGRLGITVWRSGGAGDEIAEMVAKYQPPASDTGRGSFGEPEYATRMLGEAFELEFIPEVWMQTGTSGEEIWKLATSSVPQLKLLVQSLDPPRREVFHRDWVAYYERFRDSDVVRAPNEYMLILGRRRRLGPLISQPGQR